MLDFVYQITRVFIVVFGVLLTLPAQAQSRHYSAEIVNSAWSIQQQKTSCSLSHAIPRYGEAVFVQKTTGELGFSVRVFQRSVKSGKARLRRTIPVWRQNDKTGNSFKNIGRLNFKVGNMPFNVNGAQAWQILNELEQGSIPTLVYKDWSGGKNEIAVYISPVNFLPALEAFHHCTLRLTSK